MAEYSGGIVAIVSRRIGEIYLVLIFIEHWQKLRYGGIDYTVIIGLYLNR